MWETTSAADLLGPVAPDVGAHCVGHGLRVSAGVASSCSQPCSVRNAWDASRVALAEQAKRLLVGRVHLAAIDRQPGRGDEALVSEPFDVVGHPAGADGLGLAGVAQHPYRTARAGVHRGQDGFDFLRRGLGHLVKHDDGAGRERPVGQLDPQPGDRPRLQAGTGQLGHRLGRGGHGHDRAAVCRCGLGGGVEHGGLPVPGRGEHRPEAAALPGQHLDRRYLVLPELRRRRQRRLQDGAFDSRDLTTSERHP